MSTNTYELYVAICESRVYRGVCPEPAGECGESLGPSGQAFVNFPRELGKERLAF